MWPTLRDKIFTLHARAAELPYVGVLIRAGGRGHKDLHKDMAASIAYYTFLSLFPLLLGLIALGGFFLTSADIQLRVNNMIVELLPVSSELITRNIESLIEIRGAAGVTSIVVLLWSASKMVGAISRSINRSLGLKRPYAIYFSPLRYFGLTVVVTLAIFLNMTLTPLIKVLAELQLDVIDRSWNVFLGIIAGRITSLLLTGVLIATIYAIVPYRRLPWRELLPGILVASVSIEAGKELFTLYIELISLTDTVYGSVSSVIVLLIWFYFSARVLLYGAEVVSEVRRKGERRSQNLSGH